MKKEKTDPFTQWYEISKHEGEEYWTEMRNVSELTLEEYYDLWEGDRL